MTDLENLRYAISELHDTLSADAFAQVAGPIKGMIDLAMGRAATATPAEVANRRLAALLHLQKQLTHVVPWEVVDALDAAITKQAEELDAERELEAGKAVRVRAFVSVYDDGSYSAVGAGNGIDPHAVLTAIVRKPAETTAVARPL